MAHSFIMIIVTLHLIGFSNGVRLKHVSHWWDVLVCSLHLQSFCFYHVARKRIWNFPIFAILDVVTRIIEIFIKYFGRIEML